MRRRRKRASRAIITGSQAPFPTVTISVDYLPIYNNDNNNACVIYVCICDTAWGSHHTVHFDSNNTAKEKSIVFACEKYNDAERWVSSVLEQITQISRLHSEDKITSGRADNSHLSLSYAPPPDVRLSEVEEWVKAAGWRVFDIQHGVRVYELEGDKKPIDPVYSFITTLLSPSPPRFVPPCLRVSIPLNNSPLDVFGVITSYPAECRTGVIRSFRVVESIDNSTDVVHLVLNPIFIYPTWTGTLVPYGLIYSLLYCSLSHFLLKYVSSSRPLSYAVLATER